ncbi:MAG: RlmE family RNA methyltransferase [Desulfovibrionaceae bacterium]|nr:RlmE family RNA methyltransferase [Desulfovibrionaceae bacterium]
MKEYRDHYFLKAKRENYPARSVYKLQELDAKFHLLKSGQAVLDLGAAPGSWSLYAAQKIGANGLVLACDLKPITISLPGQIAFFTEDVFERSPAFEETLRAKGPFDLVMSDMAPATTGSVFTDQARSFALAEEAFHVAEEYLKENGNFVVKIFMGPDMQSLIAAMRTAFSAVKTFKPKSSRSESKETFITGLGFCGRGSASSGS